MTQSEVLKLVTGVLSAYVRFGQVVATSVVSGGIRATLGLQGPDGDVDQQELWGTAGFLARPPAGAEVMAFSRGGEAIVFATKARTFEVDLESGEVAMYNLTGSQTVLKIDADGNVSVTLAASAKMTVTAPSGTPSPVVTKADFDAWRTAEFVPHIHTGVTTGPGLTGVPQPAAPPVVVNGSPVLEVD